MLIDFRAWLSLNHTHTHHSFYPRAQWKNDGQTAAKTRKRAAQNLKNLFIRSHINIVRIWNFDFDIDFHVQFHRKGHFNVVSLLFLFFYFFFQILYGTFPNRAMEYCSGPANAFIS